MAGAVAGPAALWGRTWSRTVLSASAAAAPPDVPAAAGCWARFAPAPAPELVRHSSVQSEAAARPDQPDPCNGQLPAIVGSQGDDRDPVLALVALEAGLDDRVEV